MAAQAKAATTQKIRDNVAAFGFNGQQKVNEIAGVGNHTTALFWEYDTRLGRRWNLDPVVKPWESRYATMGNTPIWHNDVLGDHDDKQNVANPNKDNHEAVGGTGGSAPARYMGRNSELTGVTVTPSFGDKVYDKSIGLAKQGWNYINTHHLEVNDKTAITYGVQAELDFEVNGAKVGGGANLFSMELASVKINSTVGTNGVGGTGATVDYYGKDGWGKFEQGAKFGFGAGSVELKRNWVSGIGGGPNYNDQTVLKLVVAKGVGEQDVKQIELTRGSLEAPEKKDADDDGFHIKLGAKFLLGIDIDYSFSIKKN